MKKTKEKIKYSHTVLHCYVSILGKYFIRFYNFRFKWNFTFLILGNCFLCWRHVRVICKVPLPCFECHFMPNYLMTSYSNVVLSLLFAWMQELNSHVMQFTAMSFIPLKNKTTKCHLYTIIQLYKYIFVFTFKACQGYSAIFLIASYIQWGSS